ncbi:hypothetical protein [Thermoanaerobacter uzonensis]|uniref:hypothetical protein n=1 Tax=Thermoanaerobacter uzonensis TaxID=447593 RepID=UPI003D769195
MSTQVITTLTKCLHINIYMPLLMVIVERYMLHAMYTIDISAHNNYVLVVPNDILEHI